MKWIICVSALSITAVASSVAEDATKPYATLDTVVNSERVHVAIADLFQPVTESNGTPSAPRRSAHLSITCQVLCGDGYQEVVNGCSFGIFQFLPGSGDIITTWIPECIQPFRTVIYNISSKGVVKVLDVNSSVPVQFVLGKTEHCDVITFNGSTLDFLKGTGIYKRWTWEGDKYTLWRESAKSP